MSVTTNTKNYWFEQAMQNMEARAQQMPGPQMDECLENMEVLRTERAQLEKVRQESDTLNIVAILRDVNGNENNDLRVVRSDEYKRINARIAELEAQLAQVRAELKLANGGD